MKVVGVTDLIGYSIGALEWRRRTQQRVPTRVGPVEDVRDLFAHVDVRSCDPCQLQHAYRGRYHRLQREFAEGPRVDGCQVVGEVIAREARDIRVAVRESGMEM